MAEDGVLEFEELVALLVEKYWDAMDWYSLRRREEGSDIVMEGRQRPWGAGR